MNQATWHGDNVPGIDGSDLTVNSHFLEMEQQRKTELPQLGGAVDILAVITGERVSGEVNSDKHAGVRARLALNNLPFCLTLQQLTHLSFYVFPRNKTLNRKESIWQPC